ncbi:SRPBCC domain-containing protein [Hyphococcus sp.]|uniref:SRPBCC domain-containing protein n=1 Tax=Hyphococcus sp. TaxID=2038636 RepID=UPI00208B579E|nr:MAG: ATPase [Marinicaulis sp.]
MEKTATIDPVVKTIELKASAEKAFAHFTNNIHVWWPLAEHSLSGANAVNVVFEAKPDGRIFEIDKSGTEREWGRVLDCAPPHRVVFSWILEEPEKRTEIEVVIKEKGEHACVLTLIHYGWENRSDGAQWRGYYDEGWNPVLGEYLKTLLN